VRRASFIAALCAGTIGALGCLGTSPQEREKQAQGEYEDGDEFHRPGQPCLVCHSEDFSPGDDVFQVAGTIYLTPTSPDGLAGVTVEVTDAAGRVATATTNRVGNFMFKKGDDEGEEREDREDREERDGKVKLPYRVTYPLTIRVSYLEFEQVMESVSWREGSCAHCHSLDGPHEGSEGRVYLTEVAP